MPKVKNMKKVLVVGSGPIIIGQAAEFDYSGTQCCHILREEGIETVLVNSNPATIMTDFETADKVYIEPLTVEFLSMIIEKERPDGIIPSMGGQTGLNLVIELYDAGVLDKFNVTVLGTPIEAIQVGEDRELFREEMIKIGQPVIESEIVTSIPDGLKFAEKIGYPVVVRPAFTLGGTGGGIADDQEELMEILSSGLTMSRVGQVLLEKSIKGWKEIEYEVMRDLDGNAITVCNMENIDPVGVHTGDSIVVAPSQTLSDVEYQMLRKASLDIIDHIGIVGGCNVQLALNPYSFEYAIIEINPRVSRSSALASKATGYPIAKVSTKLALGYRLDEIENAVTKKTTACFEPALDYVVLKIPKWPFDKFPRAVKKLGTKMMATGEVMSIGNSFESAFMKAVRSLELKNIGLLNEETSEKSIEELKMKIQVPSDERIFEISELIRRGYQLSKIHELTGIDLFFLNKFNELIKLENILKSKMLNQLTKEEFIEYKRQGYDNKSLALHLGVSVDEIRNRLDELKIQPVFKMVDTCAAEFEASSPYYYSTYDFIDEVVVTNKPKILVIGSGPIRIGQGIEFDYCCVHSVLSLRKMGYETVIINNNPETVSTDFNISDKLYFEPITVEDVMNVINKEKPEGVIIQFGGQTAIKLAEDLTKLGVNLLGTTFDQIDTAEDRDKFEQLLEDNDILRPIGQAVKSVDAGLIAAREMEYPLLVRPSYVLGGQGMEIVRTDDELLRYLTDGFKIDVNRTILIDQYLEGTEVEVDVITDGDEVLFPGIMEHLEMSGIHSGDSISIYPSVSLNDDIEKQIIEIGTKIAKGIKMVGILNIQMIVAKGKAYVIEVNPRASRTVPYLSKVTNVPMVDLATQLMLEKSDKFAEYGTGLYPKSDYYVTKVPVFSTSKLPNVEVSLGPEMRSTGEVLGVGETYIESLAKGFIAAGVNLLEENSTILLTLKSSDHCYLEEISTYLKKHKINVLATEGTAKALEKFDVKSKVVKKIHEGIPNVIDNIRSGEINLVVNTPTKANDYKREGFRIRRASVEANINAITSLDTFLGLLKVLDENPLMNVYDLSALNKK